MLTSHERNVAHRRTRRGALALAFFLVAVPLSAAAQRAGYRLGVLAQGAPPKPGSPPSPIRTALQQFGYADGQNIFIERRFAEGDPARFPRLAAELVALKVDVILAESTPAVLAAKRATSTIPIVMYAVTDPVSTGLVASLARPGANVTGTADLGVQTAVKCLELIHAIVPHASRVAILMSDNPAQVHQLQALQAATNAAGFTLLPTVVMSETEFSSAFASISNARVGAVIVLGGAHVSTPQQRDRLLEAAGQAKLPLFSQDRRLALRGALVSYAPDFSRVARDTVYYIDKLFKGAKPGDLPVQQPTEFEMVINLGTARLLGLTIPRSVLLSATEIIE